MPVRASFLLLFVFLAVGCDDGGGFAPPPPTPSDPTVAGVNLDTLLAAPTEPELSRVAADLQQRAEALVPVDIAVESQIDNGDVVTTVLSFTTPFPDGAGRYYGAVRVPARSPGSTQRFPLLVVVPETESVVSTDEFLTTGPVQPLGETFAQILFAGPGQTLRSGSTDLRSSEAPDPYFGPYDLEVDLLRAFVRAALDIEGDAVDTDRIGYVGFGRGGTVALLLNARPGSSAYSFRPVGTAALAPFTDYAAPSFRNVVRRILLDQSPSFPESDAIAERYLMPLRERELPRADVREAFIRWSPLYGLSPVGNVFLRHGSADTVVGDDHSARYGDAFPSRVIVEIVPDRGRGLLEDASVLQALTTYLLLQVAGED